jgi:hypothetical protein
MSLTRSLTRFRDSCFDGKGLAALPRAGRVWRILLAAGTLLALASTGLSGTIESGWSRVPLGAQGGISATLGRDDRSYHATLAPRGLRAANPRHELSIDFRREGVRIGGESAGLLLSLRAFGRGASPTSVAAAEPTFRENRVEYCREELTEWYVNGPLGLEQGFTVESAPNPGGSGPLTISLTIDGDVVASDRPDGGLTLTRSGGPALAYDGLLALDSSGHELPTRLELAGEILRIRVDDAGASYPIVIDPFIQKAKLTASDGTSFDTFGISVAVSGDTIAVGSLFGGGDDNGAAYVFVRPAGGWANATETARLTASDRSNFGFSIAIGGDTVVVGRPGLAPEAAYVFVKPAAGWAGVLTETAKLIASDATTDDFFGETMAINGDTIVVGAAGRDIGGNLAQGAAYVFVEPGGGWAGTLTENAKLTSSDGATGDLFSWDVGLEGDTVVLGAPGNSSTSAGGASYVFLEPSGGWKGTLSENAKLTSSDGADLDAFGQSVAVSGDTIFVGAHGDDVGAVNEQGSVYAFVKPASGWAGALTENAKLTASDGAAEDFFGASIAANGDTLLVGAPGDPDSFLVGGNKAGKAYVFVKPGNGWAGALTETQKLTASDGVVGDNFGNAVALTDDTVVVGAPGDEQSRGSVYVFELLPFRFLGFLRPTIRNKSFNSGQTIPVEFQLGDLNGTPLSAAEAEALASACGVQVFFSGGDPSPNCAAFENNIFQFNLKTAKSLVLGTYTITVKVFIEGSLVEIGSIQVEIE